MAPRRMLSMREQVFVMSLRRHGYRLTTKRHSLKRLHRYVIPATPEEDARGVDFWVKPPGAAVLIPVQVTQVGIFLFRKHHLPSPHQLADFAASAHKRIAQKKDNCMRASIAFVLVPDFDYEKANPRLAKKDVRALNRGITPYLCTG